MRNAFLIFLPLFLMMSGLPDTAPAQGTVRFLNMEELTGPKKSEERRDEPALAPGGMQPGYVPSPSPMPQPSAGAYFPPASAMPAPSSGTYAPSPSTAPAPAPAPATGSYVPPQPALATKTPVEAPTHRPLEVPPAADPAPLKQPVLPPEPAAALKQGRALSKEYVMEAGDHIHLTVYGEEDLSGDYIVAETGLVSLPLIGNIKAAGSTTHQVEDAIVEKLRSGYLHDPKVSVQLLNYRPFFIIGEVSKPGSHPYVDGMNVLNAVALAGGYTYRASTSRIKIIHENDPEKKESHAEEKDPVNPGDIINVPERYF